MGMKLVLSTKLYTLFYCLICPLFRIQHAEDVKRVLSQDKISRLKELRDQQLEERIQEHAKHIREWRQKNRLDKMETDLEVAKQNLEKALNLQRDLEEKRALQYRLRAFTAEEFSPPNHGKPK
eukprot:TCONS_00006138-protein